jgi:hypothetical protein
MMTIFAALLVMITNQSLAAEVAKQDVQPTRATCQLEHVKVEHLPGEAVSFNFKNAPSKVFTGALVEGENKFVINEKIEGIYIYGKWVQGKLAFGITDSGSTFYSIVSPGQKSNELHYVKKVVGGSKSFNLTCRLE